VDELFELSVEQFASELVAKRVPHDRVHADEPWREMADGEKLHEFHVDELRAGPQGQRVRLAAHVRGSAVALEKFRQSARGENHGFGVNRNQLAIDEIEHNRADSTPIAHDNFNRGKIADASNGRDLAQLASESGGDGGAGIEKVDVTAALDAVA